MAEAPIQWKNYRKTRLNPTYAHTQGVSGAARSRTSRFVLSMLSVGELMLCFFLTSGSLLLRVLPPNSHNSHTILNLCVSSGSSKVVSSVRRVDVGGFVCWLFGPPLRASVRGVCRLWGPNMVRVEGGVDTTNDQALTKSAK